jgi:hypothetical protein
MPNQKACKQKLVLHYGVEGRLPRLLCYFMRSIPLTRKRRHLEEHRYKHYCLDIRLIVAAYSEFALVASLRNEPIWPGTQESFGV